MAPGKLMTPDFRSVDSGTHDRVELSGVPPIGERITVSNITITRVVRRNGAEPRWW